MNLIRHTLFIMPHWFLCLPPPELCDRVDVLWVASLYVPINFYFLQSCQHWIRKVQLVFPDEKSKKYQFLKNFRGKYLGEKLGFWQWLHPFHVWQKWPKDSPTLWERRGYTDCYVPAVFYTVLKLTDPCWVRVCLCRSCLKETHWPGFHMLIWS